MSEPADEPKSKCDSSTDHAETRALFDRLGWWSVPLAALIAACFPFLRFSGWRRIFRGEMSPLVFVFLAAIGATVAALLTASARIKNRAAVVVLWIVGVLLIF